MYSNESYTDKYFLLHILFILNTFWIEEHYNLCLHMKIQKSHPSKN